MNVPRPVNVEIDVLALDSDAVRGDVDQFQELLGDELRRLIATRGLPTASLSGGWDGSDSYRPVPAGSGDDALAGRVAEAVWRRFVVSADRPSDRVSG